MRGQSNPRNMLHCSSKLVTFTQSPPDATTIHRISPHSTGISTASPAGVSTASPAGVGAGRWCQPSEPSLAPNQCFGRYRIVRQLGKGGMGTVYLAYDPQLDRHIALKIPKLGDAPDETIQRFYREAQAAGNLRDPRICPVYDAGQIDGVHYLALAYIEGRSLAQVLREGGPLPAAQAAEIIRQVAQALDEAHAAGIIHRDLKPANIMLDTHGLPVVMDFGLAHKEHPGDAHLTRTGTIMGTPAYMSPEQVRGETVGPAGDIYSLGATLYELLTGVAPFTGPHISAVLTGVLTRTPKDLRELRLDLPTALCDICLKSLQKLPQDRHVSVAELADALARWQPVSASRASDTSQRLVSATTVVQSPAATALPLPAADRGSSRSPLLQTSCLLLAASFLLVAWWPRSSSSGAAPQSAVAVRSSTFRAAVPISSVQPDGVTPPTVVPAAAPALADDGMHMELVVQPAEQKTGWQILSSNNALLRNGDKVQVHLQLAATSYVYLYWMDGTGHLKRLWPKSLDDQRAVQEVYDPPAVDNRMRQLWYEVGGETAAAEFLLAGSSQTPLYGQDLQVLESVTIGLRKENIADSTRTHWISPPAVKELRILRPSAVHRSKVTREPTGMVSSQKGGQIKELTLEEVLGVFDDYRGLLAPRG